MARKWCGFLPQNLIAKEEWDLIESCEHQARVAAKASNEDRPHNLSPVNEEKQTFVLRISKPK